MIIECVRLRQLGSLWSAPDYLLRGQCGRSRPAIFWRAGNMNQCRPGSQATPGTGSHPGNLKLAAAAVTNVIALTPRGTGLARATDYGERPFSGILLERFPRQA
jgi:hypothetical protein